MLFKYLRPFSALYCSVLLCNPLCMRSWTSKRSASTTPSGRGARGCCQHRQRRCAEASQPQPQAKHVALYAAGTLRYHAF